MRSLLVTVYLAAIVAANLSIAHFGPMAAVVNGLLLVGLDLSTRDYLHDVWRGRLLRNMALLIITGSVLSWLVSLFTTPEYLDVGRIALASGVAIGAAATADSIVYHVFRDRPWMERANKSNLVGASVDSVVFLTLAGIFSWNLALSLACAKVAGGVVWSMVLAKGADGRAWRARNRKAYGA